MTYLKFWITGAVLLVAAVAPCVILAIWRDGFREKLLLTTTRAQLHDKYETLRQLKPGYYVVESQEILDLLQENNIRTDTERKLLAISEYPLVGFKGSFHAVKGELIRSSKNNPGIVFIYSFNSRYQFPLI